MHRSAAEAKAEHIAKMGADLGEFYSALWQEVAWIHSKWAEYVALFGSSQSRVELLNDAAPRFFLTVQDALWESILLHLVRLTDPPESARRANLTVRRLKSFPELERSSARIASLVDEAVAATAFARDWRNRKLAHHDLGLALGRAPQPLALASRKAVADALLALVAILNALSEVYLGSMTIFDFDDASAVSLLHVLRDGLRYERERQERLKAGTYRAEDLGSDPL